jgi:hypothetical protein
MEQFKNVKKVDMITIMLDNHYPEALEVMPTNIQKRSAKERRVWLFNYLAFHVLKEDIYKMFRNYLYWKCEKK